MVLTGFYKLMLSKKLYINILELLFIKYIINLYLLALQSSLKKNNKTFIKRIRVINSNIRVNKIISSSLIISSSY